jgi:hypothetical protein
LVVEVASMRHGDEIPHTTLITQTLPNAKSSRHLIRRLLVCFSSTTAELISIRDRLASESKELGKKKRRPLPEEAGANAFAVIKGL